MTPRQVEAEFRAAATRQRRRRDELMFHAWHTAYLHRVDPKQWPQLAELLTETKKSAGSEPDQPTDWRHVAARFEAMALRAAGQ